MSKAIVERRVHIEPVSLRSVGDDKREFIGHAAVFNRWADIAGFFREQVAPKAFAKTIREADVPFVFNHDDATVMARTAAQNLELSEDKTGLLVRAPELDERDDDVRQLIVKMENGNVSGMSFAFRSIKDEWNEEPDDEGLPERTLREVALYDVSAVTNPAYEGTDAAVRAEARSILVAAGISPSGERAWQDALEILTSTSVPETWDGDPEQLRAALRTLEHLIEQATPPTSAGEPGALFDPEAARRRNANRNRRLAVA